jgi:hypothetical protein
MRFLLLLFTDGTQAPAPGSVPSDALRRYNDGLQKAGVLLAGDALRPPAMGARVSLRDGVLSVTRGAIPAGEVVAAYWLLDVRSEDEAVAWARRYPTADHTVIEVRLVEGRG